MIDGDKFKLGGQISGPNPKCPVCGSYLSSSARGCFDGLVFVFECRNCSSSWERVKVGGGF